MSIERRRVVKIEDLDRVIAEDLQAVALLHGTKPERDVAPFGDLKVVEEEVMLALTGGVCKVITSGQPAYTAGNSLVYCGPDLLVAKLLPDSGKAILATTIVKIYGHLDEELHYHSSHVISVLVEGSGYLFTDTEKLSAKAGDIVVIPRGVQHLFNCDPRQKILIFAIEISDRSIDHQKNWYTEK